MENYFSHRRASSEKTSDQMREIHLRNKDLSQFYPENKMNNIKTKARINEIKLQIQKRTKELLVEDVKAEKELNYMAKLTKLD